MRSSEHQPTRPLHEIEDLLDARENAGRRNKPASWWEVVLVVIVTAVVLYVVINYTGA